MRRTTRPAPRAAFTLIELLVVISIMALLAALVAGGIGQVRTSQMGKATDQTLTKLQQALDGQMRVVAEDARDPNKTPGELMAFCDNDKDRARALWVYLKLKHEFPQTFREARNPTVIPGVISLPALKAFAAVPDLDPSVNPREQAAALLYLALDRARGGVKFEADESTRGAQGNVQLGGATFPVYKDAWGTPVAFERFATNAHLQTAEFTNTKSGSQDPIDVLGKLRDVRTGTPPDPWATNKPIAQTALGVVFDGRNKRTTVLAAGPDKEFQGVAAADGESDDHYGYKLVRLGN